MSDDRTAQPALDPARSAAVAASAGSGKTWLLVSRIVRLLLAGAEPAGILALSFTRKAATEVRERVGQRLRRFAYSEAGALDAALREIGLEPDDALRQRARGLYERLAFAPLPLRALTLHGFCQDVLTRFALEAQVPAGFTLVEDESRIAATAFERFWQRLRAAPEDAAAQALHALFDLQAREHEVLGLLREFVQQRGDWWAFTEEADADSEAIVAFASRRLALQLEFDPEVDPFAATDAPALSMRLKMLTSAVRAAGGVGTLKADQLDRALDLHGAERFEALSSALLTAKGEPRAIKQKKGITDPQWAHLLECFHAACAALAEVQESANRRRTWQRNRAAYRLGQTLLEEFQAALDAEAALGFAELEWRTCTLLRAEGGSAWVRYKLDRHIEHVLLDEFQDTNPTQWRLLLPLVAEFAESGADRARTLFVVGDAKQSIYGFRRAAPELMQEAHRLVREDLRGSTVPLNRSRRSAPAVIDFINAVFGGEAGRRIDYPVHATTRERDWGAVEVMPLFALKTEAMPAATDAPTLRDPLSTPYRERETLASELEAAAVAARIRQLVEARVPVADEHAGTRPLHYGDVMVLARQRTHLWTLEAALARAGIPFVGSTRGALLDTVIAQDLMALLRWLEAPHRALDLAHVLRSPVFGASDADLIAWTHARRAGAPPLPALLAAAETAADPASPLARAAHWLPCWQDAARRLPAHDVLDRICREGDLAARFAAALPQEPRARANLGAFVQRVLDSDAGRYPTLGRLNAELERLTAREGEAPDEAPPPGEGARVRVLTVHAAKGLEAPAVFVVNAAPPATPARPGWRVRWPAAAEAPTHFVHVGRREECDALSHTLVEGQQQREARETLNLLYVALTRARQYLFVSAFAGASRSWKWEDSWHARCWDALPAEARAPLPPAAAEGRGSASAEFPAIEDQASEGGSDRIDPLLALDPRLGAPLYVPPVASADRGEADDPQAARRGVAIHRLLQALATGASDADRLRADLALRLDRAPEPAEFDAWLAEARAVVAAPALARFFAPELVRAWNEIPVLFDDGGGSAVLDRLVDDGTTLWVLDYKTAPRPQAASLLAQHRAQLERYAAAVRRLWPRRSVRAALIATADASLIELDPA